MDVCDCEIYHLHFKASLRLPLYNRRNIIPYTKLLSKEYDDIQLYTSRMLSLLKR